jgi:hypothetical protein
LFFFKPYLIKTVNTTENIIASQQNDFSSEFNSETTPDQIFSTILTGDSGDGEAMHRILFGEPVQITPKSILGENASNSTNKNKEEDKNENLKIQTIKNSRLGEQQKNLYETNQSSSISSTSSAAEMWWEPMINNKNAKRREENEREINDQLDISTLASLNNETNLPPFTQQIDDPIAKEVKENALLAPQRVDKIPKTRLKIFSLNYGNPGLRKQILETNIEGKEDFDNKTKIINLNEMNNKMSSKILKNVKKINYSNNRTKY